MKLDRILDGDGHVIERDAELYEYLEPPYAGNTTLLGYPFFPALDGYNRGAVMARLGIHQSYEITPQHWIDTLDRVGLESTVLYPTAGLAFAMIQDPEWATALARAYNNWFAHLYHGRSKRLRGMALIPLQSVPEAVKELRRAVTELGMLGAVLPANDADIGLRRGLGHPDFWPIYEEAERLGVPVATHGAPSMNLGINSFSKFAMTIALEHPIAQMIQVTSFVMEGVFDRFPRLRVGFLEAGTGWVSYMMDRLDRSYEVFNRGGRREFSEYLKRRPSEHFASGRMYFSCEGGEPTMRELVQRIGHKTLLFASDFPHEANVEHAMHELEELLERDDLSDAAKRGIFCDNIEGFYGR
ncbi:MAG TPA: amidohydrolase family protein [Stellaceae bacterium]|nr:amidohydrolase family protein [Stellaceae bacterium]